MLLFEVLIVHTFRGLEDIGLYGRVGCPRCQSRPFNKLRSIHLGRKGAVGCVETLLAARSNDCFALAFFHYVPTEVPIYLGAASRPCEGHLVGEGQSSYSCERAVLY